jgi:phage terminase small subunit
MSEKLLTPQQEMFLSYYTNPKSETFSNATQSAIKAGYEESYANNITALMPDWLFESIGDMKRLRKAEKNLEEVQNIQIYNDEGKLDANLIDKRTKVDFFIAERLNKQKYSTKVEQDIYVKELPKPILDVVQNE